MSSRKAGLHHHGKLPPGFNEAASVLGFAMWQHCVADAPCSILSVLSPRLNLAGLGIKRCALCMLVGQYVLSEHLNHDSLFGIRIAENTACAVCTPHSAYRDVDLAILLTDQIRKHVRFLPLLANGSSIQVELLYTLLSTTSIRLLAAAA
eukprot:1157969-Pelagomonas_calceolata.AAC.15